MEQTRKIIYLLIRWLIVSISVSGVSIDSSGNAKESGNMKMNMNSKMMHDAIRLEDVNRIETINRIKKHFTKDEILSLAGTKRIRREIRDIDYSQWMKIADAMNVMKFTDQKTGIAKYGDKFQNWDYLTCFHAQAAWQEIGNQNHFAPSFIPWHRAFELMFEESILAIDSSVEAVPYWDFRRDILNPLHSELFTEKYFGELMGDVDNMYAIKDGPFAYWPIGEASKSGPDCEKVGNMWGQMRNPVHRERSPYVTRMGSAMCGKTDNFIGTIAEYNECLNTTLFASVEDFNECWENTFHYAAHAFVGGTRKPNGTVVRSNETFDFFSEEDGRCYTWSSSTEVESIIDEDAKIYKFFAHPKNNCFDCHKHCSLDDMSRQCSSCHLIPESGECLILEGKDGSDTIAKSSTLNSEEDEYIWGDFLDAIASPNEPFFMFHHINLDRYSYIWQLLMYEERPYYKYPESGWAYGINLNDTACYEHPFKNVFKMYDSEQHLTHRDIYDATTFELSPYMYDDILEGLMASVAEEIEEDMKNANFIKSGAEAGGIENISINQVVFVCVTFVVLNLIICLWFVFHKCDGINKNNNNNNNNNNNTSNREDSNKYDIINDSWKIYNDCNDALTEYGSV